MGFRQWLYGRFIYEDDTFSQGMRKATAGCCLLMAVVALISLLSNLAKRDNDLGNTVPRVIPLIVMAAGCLVFWGQLHRKRSNNNNNNPTVSISDTSCFNLLLLGSATAILFTLIAPSHSYQMVFLLIMVMGAVMATPHRRILEVLLILGFLVNAYNNTAYRLKHEPGHNGRSLMILGRAPDPNDVSTFSVVQSIVIVPVAVLCILLAVLHAQVEEHNRAIRISKTSHVVARNVAENLLLYNTTGARAAIEAVTILGEGTEYDNQLCDQLMQIVDNMDTYRPYLPSYLMPVAPAAATVTSGAEASSPKTPVMVSDDSDSDSDRVATINYNNNNNNNNGNNTVSVVPRAQSRNVLSVPGDTLVPQQQQNNTLNNNNNDNVNLTVPTMALSPVVRCVTVALLHAGQFATFLSEGNGAGASDLADTIHTIAAEASYAVVHGIYADTAFMSWNTARKAAQHSAAAASFLARCTSEASPNCVGAAATGHASFMLCGRRQVVPVLEIKELWPDLFFMFRSYACPLKVNVCDHLTMSAIQHTARTRCFATYKKVNECSDRAHYITSRSTSLHAVDLEEEEENKDEHKLPMPQRVITPATAAETLSCEVHQIVELRSSSSHSNSAAQKDGDGEWMYVLQREQQSTDTDAVCCAVTTATALGLEGRVSEALETLEGIPMKSRDGVVMFVRRNLGQQPMTCVVADVLLGAASPSSSGAGDGIS
eukprot:PhM_4_TR3504/c0_g1_i1/m.100440